MQKLLTRHIVRSGKNFVITEKPPKDDTPYLKVEIWQRILEGGADMPPPLEYHLYDSTAVHVPGEHIVITTYNAANTPHHMYSLETKPMGFDKNFNRIFTWSPEDITRIIRRLESDNLRPLLGSMLVFSTSSGAAMQYYGLMLDLYRKGLK